VVRAGLPCAGVATRPLSPQPSYDAGYERELVFAGFLLFFDPPKSGVREALDDLAALGVRLKVITGDNRLVALHTAQSIGLDARGVLSGAELNALRDEALWSVAERTDLFVEVDPNQKERIILAL
jgi:P-type Mg2+ transporter